MRVVRLRFESLNPGRHHRGFYLIGLLIALVIIFLLMGRGYFMEEISPTKKLEKTTQAQAYIERSRVSACISERQAVKADLVTLSIAGGGRLPGIHIMRAKLGVKRCPGSGILQVDDQGNVFCTEHAAAPEGVQVQDLHE